MCTGFAELVWCLIGRHTLSLKQLLWGSEPLGISRVDHQHQAEAAAQMLERHRLPIHSQVVGSKQSDHCWAHWVDLQLIGW
jgi:hypothetical protein